MNLNFGVCVWGGGHLGVENCHESFWGHCKLGLDLCYLFFRIYWERSISRILFGPRREKPCLQWFANNECADQPAHTRSLTSACVIRLL